MARFLDKLRHYRDHEEALKWEGTFADYLELVKQHPAIAQPAHSRIYQMIVSAGVSEQDGRKHYHFFDGLLFGLDEVIEHLVADYFHPAARHLDVRKRILLLVGPVGGGKSTIVTALKRGLESYSRTDAGAVYAIKDCPMHEDPLHLIPPRLRDAFFRETGIRVAGSLSPLNAMRLDREYGGKIEDVPVERIFFSENQRIGIGTFAPSDPKSQDIADLTGSIDFSTIAEYGSESDPRAYRFDGELNKANRGLMEFQELLKCDEKFLWHLLSLTQEGNFKTGRFALISADEVVIAHTNEAEYRAFAADKKNEALHSRMLVMRVPYTLQVSEEVNIHQKMIAESDGIQVRLAPHALRAAAVFSVLTRLKASKNKTIDLMTKLHIYDEACVDGYTAADRAELKCEYPNEGMTGIDPRFIINRIAAVIVKKNHLTVTALDILRAIKEGLADLPVAGDEERAHYDEYIALARQDYDARVKAEVQKAFFHSFTDAADALAENYLDNVGAYCSRHKAIDPISGETIDPDEPLMRSVEEQIGISENAKKAFREELLIRITAYMRKGKRFNYKLHGPLKEAIQKRLFVNVKDVMMMALSGKTSEGNYAGKVNEVISRLVDEYGYNTESAGELLKYAGHLLNH